MKPQISHFYAKFGTNRTRLQTIFGDLRYLYTPITEMPL
jgi:hypothetical protein